MSKRLTPPQVARMYGVKADKVVGWIRAGELAAFNAATKPGGRPRYLISEESLSAFESRRAIVPAAPRCRPRRKQADAFKWFY